MVYIVARMNWLEMKIELDTVVYLSDVLFYKSKGVLLYFIKLFLFEFDYPILYFLVYKIRSNIHLQYL